ncbi:AAA ATPase domain protein [Burkholderia cepacia]|uniref:McrB family protein n=1 Tax=Burkholderia cepacia TaxID=292 RepID=UPI00298F890A|nr:hypothetical protein [Burkholderia cepacia]MDW9225686.1 AAA ATPase domain protein [Burkholderia cepacia]
MNRFAIVRLGKDSVADIKSIDALRVSPARPLSFKVRCSQVPEELAAGDYIFVCLGSDNNNGTATEWIRGVRALGSVTSKTGGPRYNDQWEIGLEVKVVLPESVTKKDLLAAAPDAYYWASDIPVLGVDTHSNQTVQLIKTAEEHQRVEALAYALNAIHPSFRVDTTKSYPALAFLFTYSPPAPMATQGLSATTTVPTDLFAAANLSEIVSRFKEDAENASLRIALPEAHRFLASLLSKQFLIATGLAGSGKTRLAQTFATWITPTATAGGSKNYEVVSVGADWTGNGNILGYPNGLDAASYVSTPALDLILRAESNPTEPHILILDEMNLSHVERYFADVLSAIESGEKIHLHRDADRKADGVFVPKEIGLPKNLFIIGTVNVDETTYMFSPKVLDRANVIEFRMSEEDLTAFLDKVNKPDLAKLAGKGVAFGPEFVNGSVRKLLSFNDPLKSKYDLEMIMFFKALSGNGAEFGYRVAYEAARFVQSYKELGGHGEANLAWFNNAFDYVIAQKFLPKLHGSRAKLGPLLKKLWFLCVSTKEARGDEALAAAETSARSAEKQSEPASVIPGDAPFPVSAEKIGRMWRQLNDNGFASFAEA